MQEQPVPPATTSSDILRMLYPLMVVSDLALSWYRSAAHFTPGVLLFHGLETALKLTVLLFALRNRRWAYILQLILSALALLSSLALLGQANRRAVNDPLLWISLGAQVVAGICCVIWLYKRE